MNFLDIAKTVGTAIISSNPIGALALGVVNEFLPDDNKLPVTATGDEVIRSVNSMPPELQAQIKNKQFDVTIEQIRQSYLSNQTMLNSEAISPHSTRPKIAYGSFIVLSITTVITMIMWGVAIINKDSEMVKAIMDGWPFIIAITGTFTVILKAYFGVLSNEKRDTLNAAQGLPAGAVSTMDKITGKVLGGKNR